MIKFIAETGSTNSDLMDALRAHQTFADGYWLVTDRQTQGRGRQGRKWEDGAADGAAGGADSGARNFMGSTIVKLERGEYPGTHLNLPISLAVRGAIAEFIPDPTQLMLKWPNDVLLRGAKVSGILMELFEFQVVVGIGVNLASAPAIAGRATIALADMCEHAPQRDAFARRLAHHVTAELERWRRLGDTGTRPRWLAYAHPRGTPLTVHDGEGERIEGAFKGLAASGALMLELPDGSERHIHAGDVTLG